MLCRPEAGLCQLTDLHFDRDADMVLTANCWAHCICFLESFSSAAEEQPGSQNRHEFNLKIFAGAPR